MVDIDFVRQHSRQTPDAARIIAIAAVIVAHLSLIAYVLAPPKSSNPMPWSPIPEKAAGLTWVWTVPPNLLRPVTDLPWPPEPYPPPHSANAPSDRPAPNYPSEAFRDGITGTVKLELLVGADGRVIEVHVAHTSGHRQLDNAARDQVLHHWRFQPAMRNGVAVQALYSVPIVFTLD